MLRRLAVVVAAASVGACAGVLGFEHLSEGPAGIDAAPDTSTAPVTDASTPDAGGDGATDVCAPGRRRVTATLLSGYTESVCRVGSAWQLAAGIGHSIGDYNVHGCLLLHPDDDLGFRDLDVVGRTLDAGCNSTCTQGTCGSNFALVEKLPDGGGYRSITQHVDVNETTPTSHVVSLTSTPKELVLCRGTNDEGVLEISATCAARP